MPELPEVETIRGQLHNVLQCRVIKGVEVLREKSFQTGSMEIIGKEIAAVERKAKMIIIRFKDWERLLTIHLKMTGQLVWRGGGRVIAGGHPTNDWVGELPSKHTRVVIDFADEGRLFFNDMRVFGWMRLVGNDEHNAKLSTLPPDVNEERFTLGYFQSVISASARPIKLVILDQQKMGGMGNIYANDALFDAGIDPRRVSKSINSVEGKSLHRSMVKVIKMGIKYGGASASDEKFVNIAGAGGKYQEYFMVYDRDGKACKKCGSEIIKIRLGGRGTYLCPNCQV